MHMSIQRLGCFAVFAELFLKRTTTHHLLGIVEPDTNGQPGLSTGQKLAAIGIAENERNLNNKISRAGFTAAFLIKSLEAIGCHNARLGEG